jgi:hypothetical protein
VLLFRYSVKVVSDHMNLDLSDTSLNKTEPSFSDFCNSGNESVVIW